MAPTNQSVTRISFCEAVALVPIDAEVADGTISSQLRSMSTIEIYIGDRIIPSVLINALIMVAEALLLLFCGREREQEQLLRRPDL